MRSSSLRAVLLASLVTLFLLAQSAQAADTIYWLNYGNDTIGFANLSDGGGGGQFNTGGIEVKEPEGIAIDSAAGRLYWSNRAGGPGGSGFIAFANLDGSGGGGLVNTTGAPVSVPNGIAVDPASSRIYWANETDNSIAFANLDGSGGGGTLNTAGSSIDNPSSIALDLPGGRVFWSNWGGGNKGVSFARLDGSGGGVLDTSGAPAPENSNGVTIDPAASRLLWFVPDVTPVIGYANLGGGSGGSLPTVGATFDSPYGMAFDPTAGRVYWGNYGGDESRAGVFGFAGSSVGDIGVASAPVSGPQGPALLKAPVGSTVPIATRSANSRVALACSPGEWQGDYAGSNTSLAPRAYAYQWSRGGAAIANATASAYRASKPGAYTCTVTASNDAGATAQASAALKVRPAKIKLSLKSHKRSVKAGGKAAAFRLVATNTGDLPSIGARVCIKLPKTAGKALKRPKCGRLGKLAWKKRRSVKLRLKARANARGRYKVKFLVKGKGAGRAVKGVLIVKPSS